MAKKAWPKGTKALLLISGIFLILLIGYFILNSVVSRKISQSLRQLPPYLQVSYSSLHSSLIGSSLIINDLIIKYLPEDNQNHQHYFSFKRISLSGINFYKIISSKKLMIQKLSLENGKINLDHFLLDKKNPQPDTHAPFESILINEIELKDMSASTHSGQQEDFLLEGDLTIQKVKIDSLNKPIDENNFHYDAIRCFASSIRYIIPEAYESVHLKGLELDSKKSSLHIDTCRMVPAMNKFKIGEKKGYQVDVIESVSSGIDIEKLDITQLLHQKLEADKISIRQNHIYAFRDRRLPFHTDIKPLPVDYFKTIPIAIRAKTITIGTTNFIYEEFPKDGDSTGELRILRMKVSISPFISHPTANDPAYMNMKVEGSLMGSGMVRATIQMPLRKGNNYLVEGAFQDLDLTTLNASAENLGKIHIESGLLNFLSFQFNIDEEKSTGKIVGEYHNLIIDKLKKSTEKKVDKFKSFFLKHLIIPKNKDKSMAESKRTGKVSYKRDPTRYFSYYLLHSLLVGVKSSFSLGVLLPG